MSAPEQPPQRTYRVYCFDGERMTVTGEFIEAASDEEAIARAVARDFGSRCEIWEGNRLVAELPHERQLA
jgi:hypothetical protein